MLERFFEWISEKTEAAVWAGFARVRARLEAETPPPAIEQARADPETEPASKKGRYR